MQLVVGLGAAGGVEGIGFDDIRTSVQIGTVNLADDIGLSQGQQIVVARQFMGMVIEAVAAKISIRQLFGLDHSSHGAVQQQNPLSERLS